MVIPPPVALDPAAPHPHPGEACPGGQGGDHRGGAGHTEQGQY